MNVMDSVGRSCEASFRDQLDLTAAFQRVSFLLPLFYDFMVYIYQQGAKVGLEHAQAGRVRCVVWLTITH